MGISKAVLFVGAAVVVAFSSAALADAPQSFMLQGTILTPAGLPQEATSVAFTIEIRSPGMEDCLLYREAHTLNMANSGGAFSLAIGSGTRTGGGFQETSTLKEVFDNAAANRTGLTCVTGTDYDATSGHTREIAVTFNDGSGPQTLTQVLQVQSVPYSLYAENAAKLGGFLPTDLIRVNTLTRALSQSNLESVFFNQARVDELNDLLDGASSQYVGTSSALDFTNTITMSGAGTSLAVTNASTFGGVISANNATASTSTGTGALVVAGGIGVAGAVNSGSTVNAATSMRTPIIYGSSAASGTLTLQSTSDATKGNILINPDGGNVGIGTTTPGAPLSIHSGTLNFMKVTPGWYASGGNTGTWLDFDFNGPSGIGSGGPGGNAWIAYVKLAGNWFSGSAPGDIAYRNTTGKIIMGTNEARGGDLAIATTGNVGIGTTAPATTLHVVTPTGSNQYSTFQSSCAGCSTAGVRIYNSDTNDNSAANLLFDVNSNGPSQATYARISGVRTANTSGALSFSTTTAGVPTEKLIIDSNGNVGVGTSNPLWKLTLDSGASHSVLRIQNDATGSTITDGLDIFQEQSNALAYIRNNENTPLLFGTNAVERMRIDSSGNVGIGTSSPTAALTVAGDAHLTNGADRIISVRPTSGVTSGRSLTISSGATSGTLAAGALNLVGGSASSGTTGGDVNIDGGFGFANGGAVRISGGQNDLSSYSNIFLAPNGGNVGIGTTSPGEKLEVNGTIKATDLLLSSDRTLKTDIQPLQDSLEKISRLQGVSYRWDQMAHPERNFDDRVHTGFIAQEVAKVYPDLVQGKEGHMAVEYSGLISPIVEALKELKSWFVRDSRAKDEEIKKLKAEVELLKARSAEQSQVLLELAGRLDNIEKARAPAKVER